MNKYVIYTSLTGGYDNLIQLSCVSAEFDYICFTDAVANETRNGIWTLRPIPKVVDDKQRLSRFPKMHPHVLLPEYEYSIYIDASVDIINDDLYAIIKDKIDQGVILSGVQHPYRDCAYDEFFEVYKLRLERNLTVLKKEYRILRDAGFPSHFGLYEAGMILRRHNDIRIVSQCEQWWLLYNLYAKRDQLCYTYTIWKINIMMDFLPNVGLTSSNSFCRIVSHSKKTIKNSLSLRIKNGLYRRLIKHEVLLRSLFYYYMNH